MEVVGEAVVVEEVPLVLPGEPSGACGGAGGQSDPDESPSPTPSPRDGQPQHNVINGGTSRLTPCSHVNSSILLTRNVLNGAFTLTEAETDT